MRMWGRIGIAAVGAILGSAFFGCDNDRSTGNNGTSTDNVVMARVFSVDSIAGGLVAPDTGAYPLLVALDSGDIDFKKSLPFGEDLRVQYADSTPLPFHIREWSAGDRAGSLWVRIPRSDLWSWKNIRLLYGDGVSRQLQNPNAVWNGVSSTIRDRLTTTLLADFEQDTIRPLLPRQPTDWYVGRSSGTTVTKPAFGFRLESAVEYDSARKSKVIHVAWKFPSNGGWIVIGARLGTTIHRMAALDSIVFWAKGDGIVKVALEDRRDTTDLEKAWAQLQLGSGWKRYVVTPAMFDAPDTWNKGWYAIRNRVNTFSIFGMTGSNIWVDDIRLYGVNPWELQ